MTAPITPKQFSVEPSLRWQDSIAALAEKALWTYAQAFIVALLGTTFFESLDFSVAVVAAVSTVPAGITVLLAAVSGASEPADWPYGAQVAFRVIRTGGATFLGFLIAGAWVPDLAAVGSLWRAALAAGGTALLAAIKGELASFMGTKGTPATLPKSLDPGHPLFHG